MGRGNFEGERASHCKVQGHSAVICAKMPEPIEMLFGLWARMGRRNHVLVGGPQVLRDVAMATNFGTQFDITAIVCRNFGCMTASNKLFNLRVGFRKLSNEDIAEIECLRVVAMATNFRTNTAINWLCVNDSD